MSLQTLISQEFGPKALQEFESSEFSRSRHRDYRPREPSPIRFRPKKRSKPNRPKSPPLRRMPSKKLPSFLWPCKLILKDMKGIILSSSVESKGEISILYKMICITLRKRLVILCEGKPIMLASQIVALYRERYPVTTDEALVTNHLKDLRGSHMSIEDDGKTAKITKKDIAARRKQTKEEGVEKKNGEVNEGEKTIKNEGPNEVEQDKAEKKCEVHDVTGILMGHVELGSKTIKLITSITITAKKLTVQKRPI